MSTRNSVITNMGFIGALLIVLLHVKPTPATEFENWIVDFVYSKSGFPGVAVPMFFGLSGYLLARRINERGWWRNAIKKRTRTLLVPFYAWTTILLSAKLALFFLSQYFTYPLLTPDPLKNGLDWLIIEALGLDIFHLTNIVWYLRSLFLMVIISPIFVIIIKRGMVSTILLGLLLLVIHRYGPYSPSGNYWVDSFLTNGLCIGGLLPFVLGIILRVHPVSIVNKTKSIQLGGGILVHIRDCKLFF
jgi:surface polysaccharide O-acyltransferase-like enzyme